MCSSQRSQAFELATTTERRLYVFNSPPAILVPRVTPHVYCNCPWKFVNPEVLSLSCPCLSLTCLEHLLYEWSRAYSESLNHGIMLVTPVRIWQCRDAHFTEEKTRANLQYMLDEISSTLIWHFHSPLVDLSPYKQIGAANIAVNNVARFLLVPEI